MSKGGTPKQFRIEKWFWAAQIPIMASLYFFQKQFFNEISILYLDMVSIYALVKGAGGQEQAAEAKETADNES